VLNFNFLLQMEEVEQFEDAEGEIVGWSVRVGFLLFLMCSIGSYATVEAFLRIFGLNKFYSCHVLSNNLFLNAVNSLTRRK
jgi:hypothetical protein